MQANHLVGGELTYECLGGDSYELSLTIYRDCDPTLQDAADFDSPAVVYVTDQNGTIVTELSLSYNPTGVITIPAVLDNVCSGTAPIVCVEYFVYSVVVTLPSIVGGYNLIYQRCCRNQAITNVTPGTGSTYELFIPESGGDCNNSSPVFNNLPPLVLCTDAPFVFDYSSTDPDGDDLVYSLCTPFNGASTTAPNPSPFVPYDLVVWNTGYDTQNQLGMASLMGIDPDTGLLSITPAETGKFVVGICVSEFRNGELLSTKIRDYQFNIVPCDVVIADAGADVVVCENGDSVDLQGTAFGGANVSWSGPGGFSGTDLNVTVDQSGTYTMNVTNDGDCEDSDTVEVIELDPIEVFIVEECNQEDYSTTLTVYFTGGMPAYDPSFTYTASGIADVTVGVDDSFVLSGDYNGLTVTVNVVDSYGCSASKTIGPIECIKLAVTLGSFEASRVKDAAELEWTTESEFENEKFLIESSRDGEQFSVIGEVAGAGNSLTPQSYQFTDSSLGAESAFYRIVSIDYNGAKDHSHIRFVEARLSQGISIGPNPTRGEMFVITDGTIQDAIRYELYDYRGSLLAAEFLTDPSLSISEMPAGVYILKLQVGASIVTERVVKY